MQIKKRQLCLGLLGAGLLTASPTAFSQSQPATTGTVQAPNWVIGQKPQLPPLPLLSGKTHRFESHAGRVLIIEFWHTKCPFCKKQNPLLDAFYRKHKARGLDVVTVSIDKKLSDAQDYMKDHGYAFAAGLADQSGMPSTSSAKACRSSLSLIVLVCFARLSCARCFRTTFWN